MSGSAKFDLHYHEYYLFAIPGLIVCRLVLQALQVLPLRTHSAYLVTESAFLKNTRGLARYGVIALFVHVGEFRRPGQNIRRCPSCTDIHFYQRAGGVRVPPNLTKILVEWGLEEELERATQKCRGSTFHSCGYFKLVLRFSHNDSICEVETGEPIGYLEWREDVLQETGADFLLMHVRCET